MGPAVKEVTVHLERNHIAQDMDIVHSHRTIVSKAVKIIAPNPISQGIEENLQIKENCKKNFSIPFIYLFAWSIMRRIITEEDVCGAIPLSLFCIYTCNKASSWINM